jgi:MgtE intracellular N domain
LVIEDSPAATILSPRVGRTSLGAQSVTEFTRVGRSFCDAIWRQPASDDKIDYAQSEPNSMRARVAAFAAALLSWGVAAAQTGPSQAPAAPLAEPRPATPPDARADIWGHLTSEQRRQLWQQLTPEERASVWRRLPPEQWQAIRDRLTPEQRQSIRDRWAERGEGVDGRAGPGPKLSPEERRRLREAIRDAHRDQKRGRGGRPN